MMRVTTDRFFRIVVVICLVKKQRILLTYKLNQNYMKLALSLACKAEGKTSPNPMVGAVIVKSGKVISRGYHKKIGLPHAEIVALKKAGSKAQGAHLYVNLEPCCHQGRTPPCTEAIIDAGIKKVVIGIRDPNHLVNGKGIRCLLKNGIEVVTDVLKEDCERLNESFLKYIRTKRPWVMLKSALSLDGKIATRTGDSQWITGSKARYYAHQLRNRVDAILVGAGTVLADNPRLTVRLKSRGMTSPARIVVDGRHVIPISARVFDNANKERVIYATLNNIPIKRKNKLKKMGVEVLLIKQKRGQVHLPQLMDKLGEMEITSIMVEGGSEINGNFFKEKLIDKLVYFIAPIIIGGKDALGPVGGKGIGKLADALRIKDVKVSQVGNDLIIEGNTE